MQIMHLSVILSYLDMIFLEIFNLEIVSYKTLNLFNILKLF